MMTRARAADICFVCHCAVDTTAPYAMFGQTRIAHLDCADAYDARDLGSIERPEDFGDSKQDFADAVGISLTKGL